MQDTTRYTWIIRENTSARALRGVVQALDELGALVEADVRIMAIADGAGIQLPPGLILPDGTTSTGSTVLRAEQIPYEQGILFRGEFRA